MLDEFLKNHQKYLYISCSTNFEFALARRRSQLCADQGWSWSASGARFGEGEGQELSDGCA